MVRETESLYIVRDFSDIEFKFHLLVEKMSSIKNLADLSCKYFMIKEGRIEAGGIKGLF